MARRAGKKPEAELKLHLSEYPSSILGGYYSDPLAPLDSYEDPALGLLIPRCTYTRTTAGMAHSGDVIRTELGTYCDAHGLQPYGPDNV